MILEGTDHVVPLYLSHPRYRSCSSARKPQSKFFRAVPPNNHPVRRPRPQYFDLGDSEKLLTQKRYLTNTAQALLKRESCPLITAGLAGSADTTKLSSKLRRRSKRKGRPKLRSRRNLNKVVLAEAPLTGAARKLAFPGSIPKISIPCVRVTIYQGFSVRGPSARGTPLLRRSICGG